MEFLIAFLFLVGLTVVAIVLIKRLPKAQSTSATVTQVEDLINKKKENDLRTPILLFSLFTSLVFVSWVFDASYEKMIEKKIFYSEVEELEEVYSFDMLPPPPPKKVKPKEPKPIVKDPLEAIIEEKEVIEEIKEEPEEILEEIIDNIESDIETDIDSEITDENSEQEVEGPEFYSYDELGQKPVIITNNGDLQGYVSEQLWDVKAPIYNKQTKQDYVLQVFYFIEKDGSVKDVTIKERDKVKLGEKTANKIENALKNTEWDPAYVLTKPVRVFNVITITIPWK